MYNSCLIDMEDTGIFGDDLDTSSTEEYVPYDDDVSLKPLKPLHPAVWEVFRKKDPWSPWILTDFCKCGNRIRVKLDIATVDTLDVIHCMECFASRMIRSEPKDLWIVSEKIVIK